MVKTLVSLIGLFLLCTASGCTWDRWDWFGRKDAPPPPPGESVTMLRGGGLEADKQPANAKVAQEMANGMDLFMRRDYPAAEKVFHHIADNTKNMRPGRRKSTGLRSRMPSPATAPAQSRRYLREDDE